MINDKEYKKQKERIVYLREKWVKQLGLGWWTITYEYTVESQSISDKLRYKNKFFDSYPTFEVSSDPNYMEANILCYIPNIMNLTDERLEECFLHELMHILVSPMRHESKAAEEERVATLLAKAFAWAVDLVPKKERELKNVKHGKN